MANETPKEMEYIGYSSHDAESHHKCPCCGKGYGGWDFINGRVKTQNGIFRCECGTLLKTPR
jgi:hypothetical protein